MAVPFFEVTKDQGRIEEITAATGKRKMFFSESFTDGFWDSGKINMEALRGDSFWKSSFLGSVLNFGDVTTCFLSVAFGKN